MKLGLISDIHANLPALEAVLDDMPNSVDRVVCLGDVIGYNPYPEECVELVRSECDIVLQGNHDRTVTDPGQYDRNEGAYEGLKLAKERLCDDDITYLQRLPETTTLWDTGLYAAHSHPIHTDKYVMPRDFDTVASFLRRGYRGLVLGHTHIQHEDRFDDGPVLNPGSVGQPRDVTKAGYAVVDTTSLETELRRVGYDVWETVQQIQRAGLPSETSDRLLPNSVDGAESTDSQRPGPW